MKSANGIRIEKGMSVNIVTQNFNNPLLTDGGKAVAEAFVRIYGIDLRKAGALNTSYLEVKNIV